MGYPNFLGLHIQLGLISTTHPDTYSWKLTGNSPPGYSPISACDKFKFGTIAVN